MLGEVLRTASAICSMHGLARSKICTYVYVYVSIRSLTRSNSRPTGRSTAKCLKKRIVTDGDVNSNVKDVEMLQYERKDIQDRNVDKKC